MLSCIVVGAGPGGIVCTKELLEQGAGDVLCLEKASALGGTFADTYDNLVLTSSATFSMFSDFWIGDGKSHHFWTKDEAVDYWRQYAEHFGVLDHIRFDSEVASIARLPSGGWEVRLTSGEALTAQRVALAVGNNRLPSFPPWQRELTEVDHFHSKDYRSACSFVGKRVLVVGGGESASDVALEVSRVAEVCWISLRETTGWVVPRKRGPHAADVSTHRGIWDLPREYGERLSPFVIKLEEARQDPVFDVVAELNRRVRSQRGIWGTYGTKTLALPRAVAHHGGRIVGEIVDVSKGGRCLACADGTTLDNVDAIIFSTGYKNRIDFLPTALRECDPRGLYKHMFHPSHGEDIVWIGWARPGFGSQFPIMEMQARLFALIVAGRRKLPSPMEMEREAAMDRVQYLEQFEENARRVRSLVDYHRYMDGLAALIGCSPPLAHYFYRHPRLWLQLMYGPTQATQFRLRGPGKKTELAHEILQKLPLSSFNHIVKAGLRGRIRYGLKALVPAWGNRRTAKRNERKPVTVLTPRINRASRAQAKL